MKPRARRQDPWVDTIDGPLPPRRPRKRAGQLVWPRDRKGMSIWSWGRVKDVVTGKGPDIWATRRGSLGPHRPIWSGWHDAPWADNLGYLYRNEHPAPPWPGAYRPDDVKYDFKTRSYRHPDHRTWTDAKRSDDRNEVMYHRNMLGTEFVHDPWGDPAFNPEGWNPFAHNEGPLMGWAGDEVPHVW